MPRKRIPFRCFARRTGSRALAALLLAGCAALEPLPPGAPAFGLLGDTPYSESEIEQLDRVIDDMNARPLAFVVHIGDITSGLGPCTDAWFEARRAQFARIRHPFVLLPGDNDWTDCHRTGFEPMERLQKWRSLFCLEKMNLQNFEKQRGQFCEHVRWQAGGALFVALNVQGSNNNLGRTPAMDAEHAARTRAVLAWLDDSEAQFRARGLDQIVVLMQANPFLAPRGGARNGFREILERLARLGAAYPGRVVLVNGDTHTYRDDGPIPGVRRIEPAGSPTVAWLHIAVAGRALRVDPRW